MKLKTVAERDAALKDHLETNHVFDEATGALADLTVLPPAEVPPRPAPEVHDD